MQSGPVDLVCHPSTPCTSIKRITVTPGFDLGWRTFLVTFVVFGDRTCLSIPPKAEPYRADGLWRTTCFEVFIKSESEDYKEFNFSPSGQWAAYSFDSYRQGKRPLQIEHPLGRLPTINLWDDQDGDRTIWGATCDIGLRNLASVTVGISAIIEDAEGAKSYWALKHPPGKPDFHHKDCFALKLAPPDAA